MGKEYIKTFTYDKSKLDYSNQMVELPGTRVPGQTGVYRSTLRPHLTLQSQNVFTTVPEIYEEGLRIAANQLFLGHRPLVSAKPLKFADHYEWQTYAQVDNRMRALGSALRKLFKDGVVGGGEHDTVGIWSKNTPEWMLVDMTCYMYKMIGIGLYDTLGKDAVEYIVNHAEISVAFATLEHIPFLLSIAPKLKYLKMIVAMDPLTEESKRILTVWGADRKVLVKDIAELEVFGTNYLIDPIPATPDQLAVLCYTSGTTGSPKGVMLTHGNLAIAAQGFLASTDLAALGDLKRGFSYLPLAHIYERVLTLVHVAIGGAIGFSTGDPLRLLEDVQILRPTSMAAVPRVLTRVYQAAMMASKAPGLKGALFNRGMRVKLERLHTTGERTHPFWDRLVFNKVAAALGGQVRILACGSAPISPVIMDFLRISLGAEILEGYGMTEACGVCTHVWYTDPSSAGTVGPSDPVAEIKLLDVPAMNYTSEDKPFPRGEILMRGDNCFVGYYKDPVNTKATLDDEGWVHTGDVGLIDDHGRLKIVDRVKNIMKLAQGEYVALEHVENIYGACPLIAQLFVYGDSLQPYLVGVVVPDPAQLALLVSRLFGEQVDPTDLPTLGKAIQDPKVEAAILTEMTKPARQQKLKGFEMIKRIHVTLDAFTVENGCLTPTLKVRRKETAEKYKDILDALYSTPEGSFAKL